jgi:hypothetical protein
LSWWDQGHIAALALSWIDEGNHMDNPKIVTKPVRVDFHIHSAASTRTKDVGKAALLRCTADNIDVLVRGLSDPRYSINMCAITDHDCFDYGIYRALKSKEGRGTLKKVLPGVEFTVALPDETARETPIHVVTLFDDRESDERIATIDSCIPKTSDGQPGYDSKDKKAFSSSTFAEILRKIGIGTVLIGHEKSAGREQKNDISSLGAQQADEIILTEFVDAVEIRNRHREVDMRQLVDRYTKPDVPFVLGSDCHDWQSYPLPSAEFRGREDEVAFCSLKCLPTFEGLVMSITEPSRIKVGDASFFTPSGPRLNSLDLSINGKLCCVPMSPGINVIIGDNSIGKSMILHELTGDYGNGGDAKRLKEGYRAYCERENISIESKIEQSDLFSYDDQGSIRKTLEDLHAGTEGSRFESYFQEHVNIKVVKDALKRHLGMSVDALASKVFYNDFMLQLDGSTLPLKIHETSGHMTIAGGLKLKPARSVEQFNSDVESAKNQVEAIKSKHIKLLKKLGPEAEKNIDAAVKALNRVLILGEGEMDSIRFENIKRTTVQRQSAQLKDKLQKVKTDEEKSKDAYREELDRVATSIARATILKVDRENNPLEPKDVEIKVGRTKIDDLEFISELNIEAVDRKYCISLLGNIFNKGILDLIVNGIEGDTSLTSEKVASGFTVNKPSSTQWVAELKSRLNESVDLIAERRKITNSKIGINGEPSAGLYGRIYFDLMAGKEEPGIYLVDQPEDQISQTAIRVDVIRAFSRMRRRRQIIIVTHNPQFVVNLDADNVISLGRDSDERITVRSGALEYECEEYSILDIVANTVEGGADVVRRRLKRYGAQDDSLRHQERRNGA